MRISRVWGLVLGVVLAAAPVGVLPVRAATSDSLYLGPARLVDVGGYRLNIVCAGSGSPAVIFDAGLEDWSPAWSVVQPQIARMTRTCSYDRAGNGRSDAGPFPRTSMQIVSELHELLSAAGESPPYILVGHSFGSYTMRLFADRYLDEVAGIVLVDGSHEDQAKVLSSSREDRAEWSAFLLQLHTCYALAVAGRVSADAKTRHACPGQFFRGLPERMFSRRLNAALLNQARAPKQYAASLGEATLFQTTSADEVRRARRSYGDIPLRILTATNHFGDTSATPGALHAKHQRWEHQWQMFQRSWLPLSTNARQTLAVGSGHYIQLDQPQLVLAAVREEIRLARAGISPKR